MMRMKNILLIAFVLISSKIALAGTFECQTFLNLDAISAQVVKTELKVKTTVDITDAAQSFLTEKENDVYLLEVYLPESDMRIYSEASVVDLNFTIAASIWARDYMVDVVCRKLQ